MNPNSFQNVQSKWIPEIRHYCADVPIVLVGTKIDLRTDDATLKKLQEKGQAPITREMGEELKEKINAAAYTECSASNQTGIQETFNAIIEVHMRPIQDQLKEQRKAREAEKKKKKSICLLL